jgi:glycosyltransferase involved in cell wall biosynthesis
MDTSSGADPLMATRSHVVHVVATNNFAGVERYVTYVAPLLVRAGWRVTVLGGAAAQMQSALVPAGVHHEPFVSGRQARGWLKAHSADLQLVHAHMTDAEVAAVVAMRGTDVPVLATRHFARPRGSSAVRRVALRWVPKALAAQVSISRFVAGAIGEPSRVISNGVPDAPLGSHHEKVVLVAQRLEREKSADLALRAFAASGIAAQGWQLHIAGSGSEEAALRHLSHQLGLTGVVTFLGFVNDIPERLARCGLLLAPCSVDAFGLTVAEAMACGTAVCAAYAGGHVELLEGTEAATFQPGDVFGAAHALRGMASSETTRRELGAALQARQRSEYSIERHVHQLNALYRELKRPSQPSYGADPS